LYSGVEYSTTSTLGIWWLTRVKRRFILTFRGRRNSFTDGCPLYTPNPRAIKKVLYIETTTPATPIKLDWVYSLLEYAIQIGGLLKSSKHTGRVTTKVIWPRVWARLRQRFDRPRKHLKRRLPVNAASSDPEDIFSSLNNEIFPEIQREPGPEADGVVS
jgi:hypothetical protein